MEHRRVRLGDVIDDYCPRCRLIMNHGVVGMVADEVKKVRCNTCLSEHQYRHGRLPKQRRNETRKLIEEVLKGRSKGAGPGLPPPADEEPAPVAAEEEEPEPVGKEEPKEPPPTEPPAPSHHRRLYTIHRAIAARGHGRGPKKP